MMMTGIGKFLELRLGPVQDGRLLLEQDGASLHQSKTYSKLFYE
jgi:hypothetical protein